jgi:hypothetical protein
MLNEPLKDKKLTPKEDSIALVQVQCAGFRCMAYRDETGAWIDFHMGKPITGYVEEVRRPLR